MTTKELYSQFEQLCSSPEYYHQAHYYQIRNGRVICIRKTAETSKVRGEYLLRYLQQLSHRYALPDTDFIIATNDFVLTTHDKTGDQTIPIFGFAKQGISQNVILMPDFEMCEETLSEKKSQLPEAKRLSSTFPWKSKHALGFFRGAFTGAFYGDRSPDFGNDRARLVLFSHLHPKLVDATFNKLSQLSSEDEKKVSLWLASINKKIDHRSISDHYKFKYLLDVDGNSCTYSRCRWILLSNSVLVKVMSNHVQWYYKALEPWAHFVPVKQDLSDLAESLDYLKNHDDIAFQIAKKGQDLGTYIFSPKIVDFYMVSLLNKYASYVKVCN
jgi:hypothetical protein